MASIFLPVGIDMRGKYDGRKNSYSNGLTSHGSTSLRFRVESLQGREFWGVFRTLIKQELMGSFNKKEVGQDLMTWTEHHVVKILNGTHRVHYIAEEKS